MPSCKIYAIFLGCLISYVHGTFENDPHQRSYNLPGHPSAPNTFHGHGGHPPHYRMEAQACGFSPGAGGQKSGDQQSTTEDGNDAENTLTTPTDSDTVPEHIIKAIKEAEVFCIDIDSTAIENEGIDEFAAFLGVKKEVRELTKAAMEGKLDYVQSLHRRLDIMKPTRDQYMKFSVTHPMNLTKGIEELVHKLHTREKDVFLVSGGLSRIVNQVASKLQIKPPFIYSNVLIFTPKTGEYVGMNTTELMSKPGGKRLVVEEIKSVGFGNVVMVGDGIIDAETRPAADLFICYGGNVVRKKAKEAADWFITDFQQLIDVL